MKESIDENLSVESVQRIKAYLGISYDTLKKSGISDEEIFQLAERAEAVKDGRMKKVVNSLESGLRRQEMRKDVKNMYKKIIEDAKDKGDNEKIKVFEKGLETFEDYGNSK